MTIYDRLKKGINSKINKGLLDDAYVEKTKNQLDVFFYGDRITQEQYKELMELIDSNVIKEEKTTLEEE